MKYACVSTWEHLINRVIKRVRYVILTIEDLRHDINGPKVFSKLDLANGFHQLELHADSRGITTFSTHAGLGRFRRLNFGTNSAPEIFYEELRKLLVGIKGVRNIHDDILVTGVDTQYHYYITELCLRPSSDFGRQASHLRVVSVCLSSLN